MNNIRDKSKVSSLFNLELILFDVEAENKEVLLKKLSKILLDKGYVKDTFEEAIIKREKIFPTGLPTTGVKIALPHTESEHILKGGILIANLKKPLVFKEMGNGVNDIPVELVFMLAVDQPKSQVIVLQKLMEIFTRPDILLDIKNSKDSITTMNILEEQIK